MWFTVIARIVALTFFGLSLWEYVFRFDMVRCTIGLVVSFLAMAITFNAELFVNVRGWIIFAYAVLAAVYVWDVFRRNAPTKDVSR